MSSNISDERLAELRRVAGAAAPGPWFVEYQEADGWTSVYGQPYDADGQLVLTPEVATTEGEPDSESRHIAAFDPPTVLALLAELAEYRQRDRVLATAASIAERNKELLERLGGDDELIEAAARAIKESHRPWDATEIPTWDEDSEAWRETYRDFARAAESVIAPAVYAATTAMTPDQCERLVMGPYDERNGR